MRWIDSQELEGWDSPYYWEKKLLSLLIDPQTIEAFWSDLAINRKTEQEIREIITHHHDNGKSTKPYGLLGRAGTGGALVYGPPGTGKTQLARILAHESGTVVLCATPADLVSKYWGEGPTAIQGLFNLGKLLSPSIIFIDEAEAMFTAREHLHHQHEFADLNQLLHEMDGLSKSIKSPFVLVATNLPGRLDPAVLRRVPTILKEEILHAEVDISQLAPMTPGFTGSDIRALCVQTAISCDVFVEEGENEGKRLLTMTRNYAPATSPGLSTPGKVLSDEDATSDEDGSQNHSNSSAPFLMINPPAVCVGKTRQSANYTPLPTQTSIRLLKLYIIPGPGPWYLQDHPIRCAIVVADLADFPEYFALSYTWGDPRTIYTDKNDIFSAEAWAAPAFELECDGQAVSVATNLYTALAGIREGLSRDTFVRDLKEECYGSNNPEYSYIWPGPRDDDVLGGGELIINQGFRKTLIGLQLLLIGSKTNLGPKTRSS
ncbi:AAA family ATPase [Colletotrichum musicola]|uniref:AAA family ATPase n=1 Tax=Colletotrichum musicola TaxID=2175873 RepID=A0A8H6MLL6_9PEZI|nr:AAA family ATPase [Colletotrichum musicola]